MQERQKILQSVAVAILRLPAAHVVRVAIDGVDGAGKTVFADELACLLDAAGRRTIRASVDSFHNPKATRRYVEGQQLYLHECEPRRYATIVINNEILEAPYIITHGW